MTEFAWLIEFPGSFPAWWDGRDRDTGTWDANDAVRFSRREDAERVMRYLVSRRPAIVTEHGWSTMTTPSGALDAEADKP